MGAFGAYKLQYHRYQKLLEERTKEKEDPQNQLVWVTRQYNPLDLRDVQPVPRHKIVVPKTLPLTPTEEHWVPVGDPPLRSFERGRSDLIFASYPSTRTEEWSTLRQMLPSRGAAHKVRPLSWGTGLGTPPFILDRAPTRLPKVNSPMTRYTDEMHVTNRLFKLH